MRPLLYFVRRISLHNLRFTAVAAAFLIGFALVMSLVLPSENVTLLLKRLSLLSIGLMVTFGYIYAVFMFLHLRREELYLLFHHGISRTKGIAASYLVQCIIAGLLGAAVWVLVPGKVL